MKWQLGWEHSAQLKLLVTETNDSKISETLRLLVASQQLIRLSAPDENALGNLQIMVVYKAFEHVKITSQHTTNI